MDSVIVVSIVAATATIVAAMIAAYAATRRANAKAVDDIRRDVAGLRTELALNCLKVDTMWSIYAEDAMREAREAGLVAARSAAQPTRAWEEAISEKIADRIYDDACEYARILNSPYDIATELWSKHKDTIVEASESNGLSIRALWGVVLILCINVVNESEEC